MSLCCAFFYVVQIRTFTSRVAIQHPPFTQAQNCEKAIFSPLHRRLEVLVIFVQ